MNNYELIIFDWDGTLMDSVGRIVSCMQSAAKAENLAVPTAKQVKNIIGLSLPTAIDVLFPNCSAEIAEHIIQQYKHHYVEVDKTPTPMFANALALLTDLRDRHKILAVATGKARAGLQRVFQLSDTEHFFHTSRCADEALSKPDPQMLQSILAELNISPDKALMIGDTSYDLSMAKRAGVASIGVTYGVHNKTVLSQYDPIAIVDSLAELQVLLSDATSLQPAVIK
jgi:phosphoglycolate phosphatase